MFENYIMRYCEHCKRKVYVQPKRRESVIDIRGFTIPHVEYFATCENCGELVYSPPMNDATASSIEAEYNYQRYKQEIEWRKGWIEAHRFSRQEKDVK